MKKTKLLAVIERLRAKTFKLEARLDEEMRSKRILMLLRKMRPNCEFSTTHWKVDVDRHGDLALTIEIFGQAITLADGDKLTIGLPIEATWYPEHKGKP